MPQNTADEDEIEAQTDGTTDVEANSDTVEVSREPLEDLLSRVNDIEDSVDEMIHPAAVRMVLQEYGLGTDTVDEILEDIEAVDEEYRQRQGGEDDV